MGVLLYSEDSCRVIKELDCAIDVQHKKNVYYETYQN